VLKTCLEKCGITFLFAPQFHPAMKSVAAVRKDLGIRTIFNLLGPLLNPAGVRRHVIGVFSPQWTEVFAEVMQLLESEHALIFSAIEGLDEITVSGRTQVTEYKSGIVRSYFLEPESFGIARKPLAELAGGDIVANSQILRDILALRLDGPKRDAVLLNAAAGIYVAGRAGTLQEGLALARESLGSGDALESLEKLIHYSNCPP
jgi:anthranilate phosphoribosyltransferase